MEKKKIIILTNILFFVSLFFFYVFFFSFGTATYHAQGIDTVAPWEKVL